MSLLSLLLFKSMVFIKEDEVLIKVLRHVEVRQSFRTELAVILE